MSAIDLTWITNVMDEQAFNPADPTHRVFTNLIRDLIELHSHTRDVVPAGYGADPNPGPGFGCRVCHSDEYEVIQGLGWCPTIRKIASMNGIGLPDNPDATHTEEPRAMTTPPPPATFQAAPTAPLPPQQPTPGPSPEPLAAVAAAALQAEATPPGEPWTTVAVPYGGQTYTIPAERDRWPLDVLEALEEGKMTIALRGLLGSKQWARFKATGPRTGDMGALWEAVGKAVGFDTVGE